MVGDVVGRPGRTGLKRLLPHLRRQHTIDLVIANGENAAGGRGLTEATAEELLMAGVDVITTGNHVWDQKEAWAFLSASSQVLRPLNYPAGVPGKGFLLCQEVLVANLAGRVFLAALDCPFQCVDGLLQEHHHKITIIDFHAEASSEKMAFAWYLDGRVSAVLGTHTHVPTADQRILPKGTACVSDVGMVGPYNSVIGATAQAIVNHFRTQLPMRFEVAEGPVIFNSVLVDIDESSGKATSISRIDQLLEEPDAPS